MPAVSTVARRRYVQRQLLARRAVLAVRRAWSNMEPGYIIGSWRLSVAPQVFAIVSGAQYEAAAAADGGTDQLLTAQGIDPAAAGTVAPAAFAGVASDGRDLASLLDLAMWQSLHAIRTGQKPAAALQVGGRFLELVAGTQVADAGRVADGVAITARPSVAGYVRMLNPPSCENCVVLAGKFYRWNAGFERHPRCDCLHIPTSEDAASDLRTDPRAYFDSLSPSEQDATFGKAAAKAIRDGADISQVVNAKKGMQTASIGGRDVAITTTGTTRRGCFSYVQRAMDAHSGQQTRETVQRVGTRGYIKNSAERRIVRPRLMPEQIYRVANGDRDEAVRLLAANGYLVQGVQHDAARALAA